MKKNPGVAAVLSFFIPGLGQIYAGSIGEGLGLLAGCIWCSFQYAATDSVFFGVSGILCWLISVGGAYKEVERKNKEIDAKSQSAAKPEIKEEIEPPK